MRSRRRRLARQRRKNDKIYLRIWKLDPRDIGGISPHRVWGKPIGCFDNAGKLRKEER